MLLTPNCNSKALEKWFTYTAVMEDYKEERFRFARSRILEFTVRFYAHRLMDMPDNRKYSR